MELANCYSDETCSQDYSVIMTRSLMSHQLVVAAKIVQTVYNNIPTQLYNTLSDLHIYSRITYHRLVRMKYRGRTELASNILEAANGGATKTKIMYKAFLSYAQLKEYLAMLIQNGLIAHDVEGEMYRTTSNGTKFIESSRQLGGLLTPVAPENRPTRHV
jgi:predicted transcriptional regulator